MPAPAIVEPPIEWVPPAKLTKPPAAGDHWPEFPLLPPESQVVVPAAAVTVPSFSTGIWTSAIAEPAALVLVSVPPASTRRTESAEPSKSKISWSSCRSRVRGPEAPPTSMSAPFARPVWWKLPSVLPSNVALPSMRRVPVSRMRWTPGRRPR